MLNRTRRVRGRSACAAGAFIALTVGCGGATAPAPPANSSAEAGVVAPPAAAGEANAAIANADRCGEMSDHMVSVRVEELRSREPEAVPTAAQQERIRAELRADFVPSCLEQAIPIDVYDCWMGSVTTDALAACAGSASTPTSG